MPAGCLLPAARRRLTSPAPPGASGKIQESWLITVTAALADPVIGGALAEIEGLDSDARLFLFVIFDSTVNRARSRWRDYWELIPSTFSTPLQLSRAELATLEGTALLPAVLHAQQQLRQVRGADSAAGWGPGWGGGEV